MDGVKFPINDLGGFPLPPIFITGPPISFPVSPTKIKVKVSVVLDTVEVALTSPLGTEDIRLPPTLDKDVFSAVD